MSCVLPTQTEISSVPTAAKLRLGKRAGVQLGFTAQGEPGAPAPGVRSECCGRNKRSRSLQNASGSASLAAGGGRDWHCRTAESPAATHLAWSPPATLVARARPATLNDPQPRAGSRAARSAPALPARPPPSARAGPSGPAPPSPRAAGGSARSSSFGARRRPTGVFGLLFAHRRQDSRRLLLGPAIPLLGHRAGRLLGPGTRGPGRGPRRARLTRHVGAATPGTSRGARRRDGW